MSDTRVCGIDYDYTFAVMPLELNTVIQGDCGRMALHIGSQWQDGCALSLDMICGDADQADWLLCYWRQALIYQHRVSAFTAILNIEDTNQNNHDTLNHS